MANDLYLICFVFNVKLFYRSDIRIILLKNINDIRAGLISLDKLLSNIRNRSNIYLILNNILLLAFKDCR